MELVNATAMQAGYTLGMDPDGREHLVVTIKGTFAIPRRREETRLAEEQAPLVLADEFTGEPGLSAPVYESDYALRKPRCDVLLNGSAYAPRGRVLERVSVSLKIGPISKAFDVVGDRVWEKAQVSVNASRPEPFTVMPISYDRAFGGANPSKKKPDEVHTYLPNPVGRGFAKDLDDQTLVGKPLPNTEEARRPVTKPDGNYRPMSLGPIGRSWPARAVFAGTYDQNWLDNVFPFLPADFDERYYQAAPPDQQMEYPKGGEEVTLVNLTPEGQTRFRLPAMEVPIEFTNAAYDRAEVKAVMDTIVIEPDLGRVLLTWRASIPLKRNIFEILQVVVGRMPRGWYRARMLGKSYYPSLAALLRAPKQRGGQEWTRSLS